jgi:hypothetical protein
MLGGIDNAIVTNFPQIKWYRNQGYRSWHIMADSLTLSDNIVQQSSRGLKVAIDIGESAIIVQQRLWPKVEEILKQTNNNLVCTLGNEKESDPEKHKSFCVYEGNCINLGLSSIFLNMLDGSEFQIVKSHYLRQHVFPTFQCEIMIHALPTSTLLD